MFRREVLEHRRHRTLGDVVLIHPPSFLVLTCAVALVVLTACVFLAWGSYARKETVAGYLVPDKGLVKLYTPFAGRVAERRVAEGQAVRAGEVLFIVDAGRSSVRAADVEAEILEEMQAQRRMLEERIAAQRRRGAVEVESLRRQASGLRAELSSAREEFALQRQRAVSLKDELQRARKLQAAGHLAEIQLQKLERELLAQRAQLVSLERSVQALERQIASTDSQAELVQTAHEARLAELRQELSRLDQREAELGVRAGYAVRAPVAGVVTAAVAEAGETVTPERPLAALLPQGARLQARLYLPTRAVGFVAPGQQVRLRYRAFPYQRFGIHDGKLLRVSRTILAPEEIAAPIRPAEPVYAATVELESQEIAAYGKRLPLRPGMVLEADIVLDRHSLLRWLLDPLYSLRGRA